MEGRVFRLCWSPSIPEIIWREEGDCREKQEQGWGSCGSLRARSCWEAITTKQGCWRRECRGLASQRNETSHSQPQSLFGVSQSPGTTREDLTS